MGAEPYGSRSLPPELSTIAPQNTLDKSIPHTLGNHRPRTQHRPNRPSGYLGAFFSSALKSSDMPGIPCSSGTSGFDSFVSTAVAGVAATIAVAGAGDVAAGADAVGGAGAAVTGLG